MGTPKMHNVFKIVNFSNLRLSENMRTCIKLMNNIFQNDQMTIDSCLGFQKVGMYVMTWPTLSTSNATTESIHEAAIVFSFFITTKAKKR